MNILMKMENIYIKRMRPTKNEKRNNNRKKSF